MSKATSDVDAVRWFISMGMVRGLTIIVMIIAVAVLMLTTNWRLGLVSLAFVPLVMWRAIMMARALIGTWMAIQAEMGNMTSVLQENLAGMRVVKSFGAREFEETKFESRAASIADYRYRATRLFASQGSLMTFILAVATAGILWFGVREIDAGRLTTGDLVAFILYMGLLAMPVRMSGWVVNIFSWAYSAGKRIYEVLDAESPVKEKPDAIELPRVRGHVSFERVSMTYGSGDPVVRGIDVDVEPGQMVAILGAPGSGKSTIVHLIPRFDDVTDGRVTIDGHDLRDVTLSSLRSNVGIVLQDVFVFGASVKDNIAYGAEGASMDEIVGAAKVAQLDQFVETLANGYDTLVGERGVALSGGQRQRLAIARTILLDPPVLILDDSTSSVDVGTEFEIQRALEDVVRDRTTLVIAHRLSTVRKADLVLVMERGELVERGTPCRAFGKGRLLPAHPRPPACASGRGCGLRKERLIGGRRMSMHDMGRIALDEEDRGVIYDHTVMVRLMAYMVPYGTRVLGTVLLVSVYTGTIVAMPWVIKWAIDGYIATGELDRVNLAAAAFLALASVQYVFNYLHMRLMAFVSQRVLYTLRMDLFKHLQRLSMSYFDRNEVGKVMSRVQNDVQQLQEFLFIVVLSVADVLSLVGS